VGAGEKLTGLTKPRSGRGGPGPGPGPGAPRRRPRGSRRRSVICDGTTGGQGRRHGGSGLRDAPDKERGVPRGAGAGAPGARGGCPQPSSLSRRPSPSPVGREEGFGVGCASSGTLGTTARVWVP
jgi:hypothetical protein